MNQLGMIGQLARGIGKTHAMAVACKSIGAKLICHNKQEAKRVAEEHKIETVSVSSNLLGVGGPFLIDPSAFDMYAAQRDNEAAKLRQKIHDLEDELEITKELQLRADNLAEAFEGMPFYQYLASHTRYTDEALKNYRGVTDDVNR